MGQKKRFDKALQWSWHLFRLTQKLASLWFISQTLFSPISLNNILSPLSLRQRLDRVQLRSRPRQGQELVSRPRPVLSTSKLLQHHHHWASDNSHVQWLTKHWAFTDSWIRFLILLRLPPIHTTKIYCIFPITIHYNIRTMELGVLKC